MIKIADKYRASVEVLLFRLRRRLKLGVLLATGKVGRATDLKGRFTEVYEYNLWRDPECLSGVGSRRDSGSARDSIDALEFVTARYNAVSINDIPCGDFSWIDEFLNSHPEIRYAGFDIVDQLITRNRTSHGSFAFFALDIVSQTPPAADLIFCKDLLNHLTNADVSRAIANMVDSGSKYLLASNNFGYENRDLPRNVGGASRHLDLMKEPFNFPEPIWHNHYLGLWLLSDLADQSSEHDSGVDLDPRSQDSARI